jgi:glycerol-3-phosphate dehydrogenase
MTRQENLAALKQDRVFDLLVIGGGATGCGVALDAASRGLSVALVEKNDFAEGTSSRSTKLVHGGVRYLEAAVKKFDRVQYDLVREGLHERGLLLKNARHLSNRLALVTPLYKWYEAPYVFAGLKLYDLLSGRQNIGHSRLLGRKEALARFPGLKAKGLKAGVLYYDGQFHDARMALSLALTAAQHGAVVSNHVAVTGLTKTEGRLCGAQLTDSLSGESWQIKARGVINAAGPFVDAIRQMDDPERPGLLSASRGVHLILDKRFAPPDTGLMIPKTEDGRVLFVLPWEGHALVGTTDAPAAVSEHPEAQESEIDYLLRHIGRYFNLQAERKDIKAVWAGLRPLVSDPKAAGTAGLVREHIIEVSDAGLLTIAGGKWTAYRSMAQDTVDHAVAAFDLASPSGCRTENLPIIGSADFREEGDRDLVDTYGFDADVAAYLNRTYGDRAGKVAALAAEGYGGRLAADHPVLEAEVVYAARNELADRVIDVLARRMPLALLDTAAAKQAAPRILELMAAELGWDEARCEAERQWTQERLEGAI